jgi:cell division protein FtsB
MDENILREKIQSIDEWIEKSKEMNLFSTTNILNCLNLITKTNETLASQAAQISKILQMVASQNESIEKLKQEVQIIKETLFSFGETEN